MSTGGAILSLFYEPIQMRCGSVPIPVVFGNISTGKSNVLRIAIAMCNNLERGFITHLTESSGRHKLAGSLPFVYDDPSNCEAKSLNNCWLKRLVGLQWKISVKISVLTVFPLSVQTLM